MPCSLVLLAKRALVKVLISLATVYDLGLNVSRESSDTDVSKAYRQVVLRAHPDKGGSVEHAQELQKVKEAWDKARAEAKATSKRGRKATNHSPDDPEDAMSGCCIAQEKPRQFRVRGQAVMLTYHGFRDVAHWRLFVAFVKKHLRSWRIKHWCTTLETTKSGKLHAHLMIEFRSPADWLVSRFAFEGRAPRADVCDLLEENFGRKKMRQSIDRAMFYVYADKIGTVRDENDKECTTGNYMPAWETGAVYTYPVSGKWPDNLWKAYKLTAEVYEQKYLYRCRDGVLHRKRNLDAAHEHEEGEAELAEMAEVAKRIRSNCFSKPFPHVPDAALWLQGFTKDSDRYPFLLVVGPSHTGKTEWAKSLFKSPHEVKIGTLEHFPDSMRGFSRRLHDGLVVDDIRDFAFLVKHQEKFQSKYDLRIEFASTPGGQCAYTRWLWRVPVVVTANLTTVNRNLLDSDDFLGNPRNRVLVNFPPAGADTQ